ncbi:MAG: type I secretion system permease/ATPase [Pseudomonadota bacterium]
MKKPMGHDEMRAAMGRCRSHFTAVFVFSIFVNLLMLTGPLFMLQTYDRVLSSRSEETLVALVVLITALFAFYGLLEFARGRVLSRAGARFAELMDNRVFIAVMRRSVAPQERARPNTAARDLDSIKQLLAGPAPFALVDIPWTPIFLTAIFIVHPLMGWVAVGGGAILIVLTALNQYRSHKPNAEAQQASAEAENLSEEMRQNAEVVQGLGMRDVGMNRWRKFRRSALEKQLLASDRTGSYSSSSKAMRFYLQSIMLAVGAWLALQQLISPGMMIAGSILMGRALAPIEQAIAQWALGQRAHRGWKMLGELLEKTPPEQEKTQLPTPKGYVRAQAVAVLAPGEQVPALRGVDFAIEPGQAMGVIGPSGAGKTTLAKVLTGIWQPAAGNVRLDGAALDQWPDATLGRYIGYLPQEIGLFAGSVAQNIARMAEEPDDAKVIEAAKRAGAHDLLLHLPQGYDTDIGAGGQRLSGGQRQRVALARALYDDPPLLVLDEPNANLDAQGEQALVDAIRDAKSRGRTVIIMAHRPSAIAACDLLLMIDKGQQVDFGPRDEVLKKRTKNYQQLNQGANSAQGVTAAQRPAQPQPKPQPAQVQTVPAASIKQGTQSGPVSGGAVAQGVATQAGATMGTAMGGTMGAAVSSPVSTTVTTTTTGLGPTRVPEPAGARSPAAKTGSTAAAQSSGAKTTPSTASQGKGK